MRSLSDSVRGRPVVFAWLATTSYGHDVTSPRTSVADPFQHASRPPLEVADPTLHEKVGQWFRFVGSLRPALLNHGRLWR